MMRLLLVLILATAGLAQPLITHGQMAKVSSFGNDLFWNWRRNNNLVIELDVQHPARLRVAFNAAFGLNPARTRMSVWAVSIGLRGPAADQTWPGTSNAFAMRPTEIPGCFARGNILPNVLVDGGGSDRHKYASPALATAHYIATPGRYRVEVWARARSSANPGTDGEWECPGADGNIRYDFDAFDAYAGSQPQNHLTVELE